ncbi:MAG TPA: hypothetical protein VM864_07270, partial [Pyrinomonadaceae bacterium]|nr:hypothetical protein [Pyrinomonadaceae bacterium]
MKRLSPAATLAALALFLLALPVTGAAQQPGEQPDGAVDAASRRQIIDTISKRLNESYVFPEVAQAMEKSLRERAGRGEYEQITSAQKFAETLTEHLQAVSKDRHLRVRYSHQALPERGPAREPTEAERAEERRELSWMNHGFNRVERLRGNVGYIEFNGFMDAEAGAEAVAAAM